VFTVRNRRTICVPSNEDDVESRREQRSGRVISDEPAGAAYRDLGQSIATLVAGRGRVGIRLPRS
jgi:hypothetical protein